MQKKLLTGLLSIGICANSFAQVQKDIPVIDGFNAMMEKAAAANPDFNKNVAKLNERIRERAAELNSATGANKTTATVNVPIVFHIVLTTAQLNQIGGQAGVIERIKTQLDVLNKDYNAANPDAATIPTAFKSKYGNAGIHFSLAHKDPAGNFTQGYEFITTTKNGFDAGGGTVGSKNICSDAKFAISGGANAWDPTKYINVWVINITPAGVGGLGTPPPYDIYGGTSYLPWNEQGIAMAYYSLGKRTSSTQFYPSGSATAGRTLVHEMGHYFNLFHPCGISTLNNSNCQDDDGVADTPPSSAPIMGTCATFPVLDACSPNSPGVMYMNHMDYTADSCRTMFSKEQVERMHVELAPGGFRASLTQDPTIITYWPTDVANIADNNNMQVYPNPATKNCTISFNEQMQPKEILLMNNVGQVVKTIIPDKDAHEVYADLEGMTKGIYTIRCRFDNTVLAQKLVIN